MRNDYYRCAGTGALIKKWWSNITLLLLQGWSLSCESGYPGWKRTPRHPSTRLERRCSKNMAFKEKSFKIGCTPAQQAEMADVLTSTLTEWLMLTDPVMNKTCFYVLQELRKSTLSLRHRRTLEIISIFHHNNGTFYSCSKMCLWKKHRYYVTVSWHRGRFCFVLGVTAQLSYLNWPHVGMKPAFICE